MVRTRRENALIDRESGRNEKAAAQQAAEKGMGSREKPEKHPAGAKAQLILGRLWHD